MAERVLTQRDLNRALLARQLLLDRVKLPIPRAVDRIAGVQNQYAPNAYIRLWSCLDDFARDDLTRALERRTVIQATLMRSTIHSVSRREYWLFAMGVRRALRDWWLRQQRGRVTAREMEQRADRLRAALSDGPRSVAELGELASGFLGYVSLWVELVRVPPSGTWERRRADLLATAEEWLGPCRVSEEEGLDHLVRSYLRGFGPAAPKEIANWAGVPAATLEPALARLELRRFRDENGRGLVDLPRAPLPHPEAPAPVRFLPTWDATLLVHARRTGILPEQYRPIVFNTRNPFSMATFLVEGAVAGRWKHEDGRIRLEPFGRLPRGARRELEDEAERLAAFHA